MPAESEKADMPANGQAQDTRVRNTTISLRREGQLGQMSTADNSSSSSPGEATCQYACCTKTPTVRRPSLKRNPTTNHSATSAKSVYSTGTDGSPPLQSEDGSSSSPDFGDNIDSTTFEQVRDINHCQPPRLKQCERKRESDFRHLFFSLKQILEMDDDEEEREFSKSIVYDFFTQAESTFQKMDSNL